MAIANLPVGLQEVAAELSSEDELLTAAELEPISIFQSLKKAPSFLKFPGSTVLRRCRKGRVLCSQGDAGATAYYILTTEDVLDLRESQLVSIKQTLSAAENGQEDSVSHPTFSQLSKRELETVKSDVEQEIESLKQRVAELEATDQQKERSPRQACTARLLLGQVAKPQRRGFFSRLFGGSGRRKTQRPDFIPMDGPTDIDTKTMNAPLYEGEVFGEMSCFNRAPRSATVFASQDCYLLEMLRNVLDMLNKDPEYKQTLDARYRERVLEGHMRRLSVFSNLSDEEYDRLTQTMTSDDVDQLKAQGLSKEEIRKLKNEVITPHAAQQFRDKGVTDEQLERFQEMVKLVEYDSGNIIFEEFEESDAFFVIRSGLVKVVSNAANRLIERNFSADNWKLICGEILAASDEPGGFGYLIWNVLSADVQDVVENGAAENGLKGDGRKTLIDGLNQFILQPDVSGDLGRRTEDVVASIGSEQIEFVTSDFPFVPGKWSDVERRCFYRAFLEFVCPTGIPRRAAKSGPRRTLAYLGRGDFFGEMGVITNEERSATCYAYDHPDGGSQQRIPDSRTGAVPSRVELVRIGKKVFNALFESSAKVRENVNRVVEKRKIRSAQEKAMSATELTDVATQSPEFENLGLIQGQKLMIIDLDRCTRCNQCVEACVKAHDDGRTRLYLDGPRFEKFLVPLTCRSCLDPVCMIGCPVGSINRGENNEINIEDWCIGCNICADQCPYGAIQMTRLANPVEPSETEKAMMGDSEVKTVNEQAVVCDLCSSLPSKDPACCYACPHDAAMRVNGREFFLEAGNRSSFSSQKS